MKRPIDHRNPHIAKRIARDDSGIKPFFHTLFDRWNELSWNRAADSLVDELQSFTRFSTARPSIRHVHTGHDRRSA